MDDVISRQQAIDVVVFECGEWMGLAREISKQLRQMPSAEPDTYWKEQCQSYEQTINKLRESLSTQPEIIRCCDCRYYNAEEKECLDLLGYGRRWEEDDFCSLAERREVTT